MVAAFVVVGAASIGGAVAFVPAVRQPLHRPGLLPVEPFKEVGVDHLAVMAGAPFVNFDCPPDLLLVGRHDVDQVP